METRERGSRIFKPIKKDREREGDVFLVIAKQGAVK